MVSKVRSVRLGVFSGGGCHHPNSSCNHDNNIQAVEKLDSSVIAGPSMSLSEQTIGKLL